MSEIDGMLNVYKERGFTSHDVVARLRGILGQRKVGHTGTLDPEAEGVLPVCLGRATKAAAFLAEDGKTYEAVLQLGVVTDTQDMTGNVLERRDDFLDILRDGARGESADEAARRRIRSAILSFEGEGEQIPPMYSARKYHGKRLYELAREGVEVERAPRPVTILSISVDEILLEEGRARITVDCSKGTYIRTLCHDIGQALGCGAAMLSLRRTRAGRFFVKDSLTLGQIEGLNLAGGLRERVIPVDGLFPDFPKVFLREEGERLLRNGNPFRMSHVDAGRSGGWEAGHSGTVRAYDSKAAFVGLYSYEEAGGQFVPLKIFA